MMMKHVNTVYRMMQEIGCCRFGLSKHRYTKTFLRMTEICFQSDEGIDWFFRKSYRFGDFMTPSNETKFDMLREFFPLRYAANGYALDVTERIRFQNKILNAIRTGNIKFRWEK